VASIIRTIRRAIARLAVEPGEAKSAGKKPAPKRQRRKGGRLASDYRAAQRAVSVKIMKVERRTSSLKTPQPVALPRDDGKCRDRECGG
jgi:hypothetical protein